MLQLAWRAPAAPRPLPIGHSSGLRRPARWRLVPRLQHGLRSGQSGGEDQHSTQPGGGDEQRSSGHEGQPGGQPGAHGSEEQPAVHISLPWGEYFRSIYDELQQLKEQCRLLGDTATLRRLERSQSHLESIYKAVVVAKTEEEWSRKRGDWNPGPAPAQTTIYERLEELAAAVGLPHDEHAMDRMVQALACEHQAAHALRRLLSATILRVFAKRNRREGLAAVHRWRELPAYPASEGEWQAERRRVSEVMWHLRPGSELHRVAALLLSYCKAAEADAAAAPHGQQSAVLALLASGGQQPGEPAASGRAWPATMTLALALTGSLGRELVSAVEPKCPSADYPEGALVVRTTRLTPKSGLRSAKRKSMRTFKLAAWMHAVLGVPLPPLVGRICVPRCEERVAEFRLVRGGSPVRAAGIPGVLGAATADFAAYSI